jgi:predicted RNA-binding protein associated with RNAse of E/G family
MAMPMITVHDTDDLVVLYVAPGTTGVGAVRPPGKRDNFRTLASKQWELGPRTWERTQRLCMWRPDEHYAAGAFWDADGTRFLGWYVDVIDPLRRTDAGFDFRDLELDIVIGEDLSWSWKDQEEVDLAVDLGIFTGDDAAEIRAHGDEVVSMIERGDPWWTSWRDWAPDPSWPTPALPGGWNVL